MGKRIWKHLMKSRMANVVYRGLLAALILVLAAAFTLSITYSKGLDIDYGRSVQKGEKNGGFEYNFLVLMYQTCESFLSGFGKGVFEAAADMGILVDFVNAENMDQAVNLINIAVAAKVDGIIAQGIYDVEYIAAINKAIEKGIPVEFVHTDARGTNRDYFVGFNAYDLGKKAAAATVEALGPGEGEIALLVQSVSDEEKDITGSLIIEGYKAVLDRYDGMTVVEVARTSPDLLSAENITCDILSRHPGIDAIVCTNEKDTFGAAQVIIDLNRVRNIQLIGSGVSPEMLRYIELGILDATFDMRPEEAGRRCIEAMADKEHASDFIEIPFDIVTRKNAGRYVK